MWAAFVRLYVYALVLRTCSGFNAENVLITQPVARTLIQQEINLLATNIKGLQVLIFAGDDKVSQHEGAHILIDALEEQASSMKIRPFWVDGHHASDVTSLAQKLVTDAQRNQGITSSIIIIENAENIDAEGLELVLRPIQVAFEHYLHITKDNFVNAHVFGVDLQVPSGILFLFMFNDIELSPRAVQPLSEQVRSSIPKNLR